MAKTSAQQQATGSRSKPAADEREYIPCRAPDREEPRFVEKWKFDRIRTSILAVVPANDIGVMYKQLTAMVRANLNYEERAKIGKLHWHTTTVKLEMEVRGEINRIEGARPQYLRRCE